MYLAGIDIGTTGCKITVYDNNGVLIHRAYRDYPVSRNTGKHEIDAGNVFGAVKEIIKEAAAKYPDIAAIGVTSFGESCVMLDENDMPVAPVMLYTDPRGEKECRELTHNLGKGVYKNTCGLNPHSMYSLPKILWYKKNKPDSYKKVKRILMMEDYIIYMLTGNAVIDYSLAARSMAFDVNNLCWSDEILQAAKVEKSLFSTTAKSGTSAGTVKETLARDLGLKGKTAIVPVGHDQVAAAIGTGVFTKGTAALGMGTVACLTPVFDKEADMFLLCGNNYAVVPYLNDKYVTYAFTYTGGALTAWYLDNMAKGEKRDAEKEGISVHQYLERQMKDEPTGILVLPHFAGAATPHMDTGSRGAIIGLSLEHNTATVYKAMMEGVAYEILLNYETLKRSGVVIEKIAAAGGGAASEIWMQIMADMLSVPVSSLVSSESGAAGCAMTAGITAGIFKDLDEAARIMVRERKTYYPRQDQHIIYMKYFEKYKELYSAVRPLI